MITGGAVLFALTAASLAPAQTTPPDAEATFVQQLIGAARAQESDRVVYDGSYRKIPYPGGDVASTVGVCTDLIIRAYRAVGVDLQQRVHEDMSRAFDSYPKKWGLPRPDPSIDHRRVANLQTYFRRRGSYVAVSQEARDYLPGDLVTWMLPGDRPHIGLVTDSPSADGSRPLIAHNIGNGPELEDMLFRFPITGHYRYRGD